MNRNRWFVVGLVVVSAASFSACWHQSRAAMPTAAQGEAPTPLRRPAIFAPVLTEGQFSYSQVNCSGFMLPRNFSHAVRVSGGEDGLQVSQQKSGDIIYLANAGETVPGTWYRVMRAVADPELDQFSGQRGMMHRMGRLYESVGSALIIRREDRSAIARVGLTCRPIEVGDFAVPWKPFISPTMPMEQRLDITQPLLGPLGLLVAARDYKSEVGEGDEVYLTWRQSPHAKPGQRWLIFRRNNSPSSRMLESGMVSGKVGYPQPGADISSLLNARKPADIVGEVTILWVNEHAATGIITYSRKAILPGDEVGLATHRDE